MGDVAMTVPVIRALTEKYPDCKITVLSKPFFKPLFDTIPQVSFFAAQVNTKHKGILGLLKLYRELKKEKITHVADFHNVLRSKILRALFIFDGKPSIFIDKGRAEKKALTRTKNKIFKQLKTSHQRYADVLNKLGFTLDLSNPTPINKIKLAEKITLYTGLKKDTWIGIAPFAAFKGKVYPPQLMEEVIEEMASKGFKIFLFGGGKREIEILNTLENIHDSIVNLAGKLSFKEELEVIGVLDLMVAMDSGNAHLAAMQQVKTITLWGVTHPYAGFAPFDQPDDYSVVSDLEKYPKIPCSIYGNKVANGYENVMETIAPTKVIEKIMYVLNN
ncbi:glycosyltransferase family 9 protein [Flavobacteriaceae bacterium]|jgi:ADP-heptose:LPS heptosyltransferase|nr:glycosyltransferase family 9 protein [Flavobacteriaceae bacterium]MDB4497482.1 glycosyltransferase family 9 protein [Flavobacteriaceae bacterium]MDC1168418.1 glycosyltransferase family 9 protein [Flavobacteriaceae bacterium]